MPRPMRQTETLPVPPALRAQPVLRRFGRRFLKAYERLGLDKPSVALKKKKQEAIYWSDESLLSFLLLEEEPPVF